MKESEKIYQIKTLGTLKNGKPFKCAVCINDNGEDLKEKTQKFKSINE